MSLTDLVNAMEDAGTVDLHCNYVLPWGLRVLGTQSDPATAERTNVRRLASISTTFNRRK